MRASDHRNRRVMSTSSSFGCSSSETFTGSSAIPQIGHEPGPFCRTSGCIGQVYSASDIGDGRRLRFGRALAPSGVEGPDELLGIGLESREAALSAEIVRSAAVLGVSGRFLR